ncbi:MAG: sel1 repeat family protein [Proteobacteria bacterium]|nr:sel1 repeat family protein [Pseudomonadota bacterium]
MTTPKAKLAGLVLIAALCAGFTLGLTAPAWAGFDEGVEAFYRGDYATALRELRPLAEQGNANAQFFLGFMYDKGQGVPQDYAEAVKWYRKAAEQGHADAQFFLGYMYAQGDVVPQNYAKAVKWYRKAAEQDDAEAEYNLGFMYGNGQGVPQDYVQAHMWYNLAASRLPPGEDRDEAVKNRDIVAKRMTPAQISEAQKLAREWKPKK